MATRISFIYLYALLRCETKILIIIEQNKQAVQKKNPLLNSLSF
ncbi:hypothetical protein [Caldifermentibacillus hisashii]